MTGYWNREKEVEWARSNNFRNLLGIEVERVEEGFALLSLQIVGKLLQAQNIAHGGVLATLVDGVIATAARTVAPEGAVVSTLEMNLNYVRPARTGKVLAEGKIVQAGRTIVVGTADIKDEAGNLLATGRATYIITGRATAPDSLG
jgi:uncharacterized protein (TIGR00369 family)